MIKRSVKICAGDSPAKSSIFVETKVLPQMATTTKATRWYVTLEPVPSNGLLLDFNVALNVITDLRQITLHAIGILVVDNLKEFFQLCTDLSYL